MNHSYIFTITPDELEKHVGMMRSGSSDNCICHFDIKIFLPQYCVRMKTNFFHLSGKVIDSDSDIDEAFKFMDQSIMTK